MMPTPAPAPPMPMQAIPAPMYFAAIGSMKRTPSWVAREIGPLVARMDGIVDINAGEDSEDVGLEERNQQLERGQRDHHAERQYGAEVTGNAKTRQQRNEACEHRQCDMARQ